MKTKFSAGEVIKPAVILLIICLVTSTLLALTNEKTAPKIDELAKQTELESRKKVLPQAKTFEELTCDEITYCVGKDDLGLEIGYIFTTVTKGYGGDVKVMTGVDSVGEVAGIQLLELSETVGLGMKAKEPSFLDQFVGKIAGINVTKTAPAGNDIQALTGATITSNAVTKAINEALDNFKTIKGGADNG